MATDVTMPALGESVTEGTVTTWLKSVGDTVALDEPLVEVSTDKVDSEVPSPAAGVLLEILVQEDDTVEVGTVIARIGDASEVTSTTPVAADLPVQAAPPAPAVAPAPVAIAAPATPDAAATGTVGDGVKVTMPALGESVSEGTVTTWLKAVGDRVEADEALLEVSTDKVDSEVPSPATGWLAQILVDEDETVEVGTVLAVITETEPGDLAVAAAPTSAPAAPSTPVPGEASAPAQPAAPQVASVVEAALPAAFAAPAAPASAPAAPVAPVAAPLSGGYVTPIVRKLAREAGVDLATVTGTGVGGRIRREDVEAAAAALQKVASTSSVEVAPAQTREPSPLRGTTEKMSRLRQTISRRMVESLQTAAQLTTVIEVDVTKIAALRAQAKDSFAARENAKLTFLPFFVKAATEALLYHPKINATIADKEVTYFDHEHIGIAVDTERGLLVPVIKDAGTKSLADLARSIGDLAARTRNATASADELSGSTFTITNTGSGGALFDTPVLNMPETAIMGVGTIVKRPVVVKDTLGNDSIAIRSMVYLSLSYDHRLVDGADASRFLMDVKKRLEEGAFETELGL
ncbi:2-oxoglutarate dehydrogenase, E2 component, dihydrolipoamide succinyltransferase [Schaalia suimastitidis]|uniref:2-oxoglutarate dehydrogenase, E2 component, dihydrolipoamide succinyltransferase n=1 Tax=Schaalia suimastitidis TaxID=121163 RepID=UPI00040A67E4|nr:2-oxoglutarate dehydrogenase, E2 component, dihydrolipoamide succinyltransferase [Schaalia suimastitidis]